MASVSIAWDMFPGLNDLATWRILRGFGYVSRFEGSGYVADPTWTWICFQV